MAWWRGPIPYFNSARRLFESLGQKTRSAEASILFRSSGSSYRDAETVLQKLFDRCA